MILHNLLKQWVWVMQREGLPPFFTLFSPFRQGECPGRCPAPGPGGSGGSQCPAPAAEAPLPGFLHSAARLIAALTCPGTASIAPNPTLPGGFRHEASALPLKCGRLNPRAAGVVGVGGRLVFPLPAGISTGTTLDPS